MTPRISGAGCSAYMADNVLNILPTRDRKLDARLVREGSWLVRL